MSSKKRRNRVPENQQLNSGVTINIQGHVDHSTVIGATGDVSIEQADLQSTVDSDSLAGSSDTLYKQGDGRQTEPTTMQSPISVLFLSADPTGDGLSPLRIGEELREIQEKLQLSKLREKFQLHQRTSVRPSDISQALLEVQPQIVHFSGHGTTNGILCIENNVGEAHLIQPEALGALFEQFASQVVCVLLNACYSEFQAEAIARHINYVIGMNKAISDKAAIAFTIGFYQAIGAGRTIEGAYKLGCAQIGLHGSPEHLIPVLIRKG